MLSSSLLPPFLQQSLRVFFPFAVQGLRLSRPPAACHCTVATDQTWVWCGVRTGQDANLVLSPSGFLSFPPRSFPPLRAGPWSPEAGRRTGRYYWRVGRVLPPSSSRKSDLQGRGPSRPYPAGQTPTAVLGWQVGRAEAPAGPREGLAGGALAVDALGRSPGAPPAPRIAWLLLRAAEVWANCPGILFL